MRNMRKNHFWLNIQTKNQNRVKKNWKAARDNNEVKDFYIFYWEMENIKAKDNNVLRIEHHELCSKNLTN